MEEGNSDAWEIWDGSNTIMKSKEFNTFTNVLWVSLLVALTIGQWMILVRLLQLLASWLWPTIIVDAK